MSKHHVLYPYRGRQLNTAELLALPECLPGITAKHIRVRCHQGHTAEWAILTPLQNRKQKSAAESLKLKTAKQLERARLIAVMAKPINPATTSAYYVLNAIENRQTLARFNQQ